jgi:uncharacterized membrane protein YGL010W
MKEAQMSPALTSHFADYGSFHRTPGNQACHYVGIPLIVLTLFTFLAAVPLLDAGRITLTLAELVLAGVVIYYFSLDAALAALMLVVFVLFDLLGRRLPLPLALALFVLGWALQFAGHYVWEKKSPAFFRNVTHLLVGPLWIAAKAVGRA